MTTSSMFPGVIELLRLAETQQRHAAELARATGEHFNIFHILRVGRLEVTTHSPMLAQLLNPQGDHGQGAAFLRLFLSRFVITGFNADTAKVEMEYHVGEVTEDSGGRIDILIRDGKGGMILIENKIYAGDQPNQMARYRDFGPQAHLFYLTLDGREPSNIKAVPDLRCISYAAHILAWLKDCRKEVACVHTVRETISQYIHLLQELTHQNTSARMNQEIVKAVTQDTTGASYLAYASLQKASGEVRKAIIAKVNAQLATIGRDLGLETLESFVADSRAGDNWFYTTSAMKAQNLKFGLRCADRDYRNFAFGFAYIKWEWRSPLDAARLKEAFLHKPLANDFWHAYEGCAQRRDWDDETMAAIISGEFAPELDALIRKLSKVADNASKTLPVQTA